MPRKKKKIEIADKEVRLKRLEEIYKFSVKDEEHPDVRAALKALNQAAAELKEKDKKENEVIKVDEEWVAHIDNGAIKVEKIDEDV